MLETRTWYLCDTTRFGSSGSTGSYWISHSSTCSVVGLCGRRLGSSNNNCIRLFSFATEDPCQ